MNTSLQVSESLNYKKGSGRRNSAVGPMRNRRWKEDKKKREKEEVDK
jgi:hypothetical protein